MTTRQELYDRIRASSKDEVVLEEMIRLGFWSEDPARGEPTAAEELRRIAEIERLLRELAQQAGRLENLDTARRELLKQRLAASRAKRAATRLARLQARERRKLAWSGRKAREILYLGEGVSNTLGQREERVRPGLPSLPDAAAIARAMGVTVGELRFLAFHRRVSAVTHWRRFAVPKKTGGQRLISAPMPRLKRAQRWILREILDKVPVHDAAHGFVPGRSIVTNAAVHVGREVVVNLDLKDFFPTLDHRRVRGLFRSLGYSQEASTILALLSTAAEVDEVELDGRRWYVHRGERRLPQGSPCSPAITNLVCRRLDQRLTGLAKKLGYTYTRYADDLTFSGPPTHVQRLLGAVRGVVGDEGFVVHPDKTRVLRKGARQEVTGLVVNRGLGVPREQLRRWRAVVHQCRRSGPAGLRFGPSGDLFGALIGFAAFVRMVDPDRGGQMLGEARELAAAHGWQAPRRPPPPPPPPAPPPAPAPEPPGASAAPPPEDPAPPKAKWWEFWRWFS